MIYQVQCSGVAFEIAFPRHILLIHPSLTGFVSSITVSTIILHNASLRSTSLLLTSSEGTTEYTTCSGLLDESSSTWPESDLRLKNVVQYLRKEAQKIDFAKGGR